MDHDKPWTLEPDALSFTFEGIDCAIRRTEHSGQPVK